MTKVGVIGLGMMGQTHLDAYARLDNAQVVAIADADPDRLSGKVKAGGNIEGAAAGDDQLTDVKRYADAAQLIADDQVQLVDICLPTPLHVRFAEQAIEAGKHVLIEKPLARTSEDAMRLADLAERSSVIAMPAMCMRFWPGWTWLKQTIDEQTYGKTLAVHFQRIGAIIAGSFYQDGTQSGGAILDIHLHDTDFVNHLFGLPRSVTSAGYSHLSGEIDYVRSRFQYDHDTLVTAEGGWMAHPQFQFTMRYLANFERATAVFDIAAESPLTLYEPGRNPQPVELEPHMGYDYEVAYMIDCIEAGRKPRTVTLRQAAESIRIVEAESQSAKTGQTVDL